MTMIQINCMFMFMKCTCEHVMQLDKWSYLLQYHEVTKGLLDMITKIIGHSNEELQFLT